MGFFDIFKGSPQQVETKDANISKIVMKFFSGHLKRTPATYEGLAKEGFEQNVWVYRCVMQRAKSVSTVPWLLYQRMPNGELKEIEDHPLLDLIKKPNYMQSGQEFIEAYTAYRLLSGNGYMTKAGPKTGPPKELWLLRPDKVQIVPHEREFIAGYRYGTEKEYQEYKRDQVIHMKNFSALDDYYGLSPISVAGRAIDTDNAGADWNASLLQNDARPSGALLTKELLTDEQFDRVEDQFERKFSGTNNAGRPLVLEGDVEWIQFGMSAKDMDFIQGRKMTLKEIAAAFQVPPELIGDTDSKTYSNYKEARYAFYMETVLPDLEALKNKLNAELVPAFGENLYLQYNKDEIEAIKENTDAIFTRTKEAFMSDLIMKNEAREAIGYSPIDDGDIFYSEIMSSKQQIEQPQEPEPEPDEPEEEPDEPEDGDEWPDESGEKGLFTDGGLEVKALNIEAAEERAAYFKAFDERREPYYKPAKKKISAHFEKERKAILKAYKETGTTYAVQEAIDKGKSGLIKSMTEIYVNVIRSFGNAVFDQIQRDAKAQGIRLETKAEMDEEPYFEVFDNAIQMYITETVAEKVVNINIYTMQRLKDLISVSMAEGESIDQIATKIDRLYLDQIINNRSEVIARTEVIGASNYGSQAAARQTGLNLVKSWLATPDSRTRKSHREADKQRRELEELYSVGGDKLRFPGDPRGEPENVIQCRCTETYETK